ncbi:hypothetical protein [Mucilaginibacter aquariorum]|uniref:Uncharacterized protein n=1 Tax=Mucilaginibacter aquariorum TaxID=2967225 RepID=A0ABT1SXK3_9SPHI|nr:hypothetical protein [Mucilaginibacter aquariorum]MCQ6956992.1 hypothetical protein [Mucilaginibacter aquariorum]
MKLTIEIDFTNEEGKLLSRILKSEDKNVLETKCSAIAKAATEEYKAMILGKKVFTRGKDMLEFRLFSLINHYFEGRIPSEQEICALFQIRIAEAKGLVNAITSKYQYELERTVAKTLADILATATEDGSNFKFALRSAFLKDEINRLITNVNPQLTLLERVTTSGGEFTLKNSSYLALKKYVDELIN